DLERRLGVRAELERADVQDRALDGRKAREVAVEVRPDQALELAGALVHAAHQGLGEAAVALVEALQAARLVERVAAGELPGVERLQRDLARLPPGGLSVLHSASSSARPFPPPRAPLRLLCPGAPRPAPRPRW